MYGRKSVSEQVGEVSTKPGTLHVVGTPIGNLRDITLRALDVLGAVDLVLAEDTRRTGVLLAHHGIKRPLAPLHEHNERRRVDAVLSRLRSGDSIALVSDAGTPLLSDPGFPLVRAARAAGIPVVPVPGPSAALAALSVAGLPAERFAFEGFLPARGAARHARLAALRDEPRTMVFYESPHRVLDTLMALAEALGEEREGVIARELTKVFETVRAGSLGVLRALVTDDPNMRRGEFVLLVHGAVPDAAQARAGLDEVLQPLVEELPLKKAVALAVRVTGRRRNEVYKRALELAPAGCTAGPLAHLAKTPRRPDTG